MTDDVPRWLIVLGVAAVALPMVMTSMMMLVMGAMGGPPMMDAGVSGSLRFVGVVPLALALVVAYGGYRALQAESATDSAEESAGEPVERLRERYLADEISEAEFERELERHMDGPADERAARTDSGTNQISREREFEG
ncbi:hypothetical protein BRC81_06515 [Halobacteriales archaeon QS_1_68_20]|nr:MAG: hypothetical protein BRC81_06515 [Halobacteriales archaeon QS_1_68_20]